MLPDQSTTEIAMSPQRPERPRLSFEPFGWGRNLCRSAQKTNKTHLNCLTEMQSDGLLDDVGNVEATTRKVLALKHKSGKKEGEPLKPHTLKVRLNLIAQYVQAYKDSVEPDRDWKRVQQEYNDEARKLAQPDEQRRKEGKMSQREQDKFVERDELVAFCDKSLGDAGPLLDMEDATPVTKKEYITMRDALIVGTGTLDYSVRGAYHGVKRFNVDPNRDNFIMCDPKSGKMHIVWNSYKTARHYGQQIHELPEALAVLLQKFMRFNRPDDRVRDYLFVNDLGQPYQPDTFTKHIKRLYKLAFPTKDLAARRLRVFETASILEGETKTLADLETIAKRRHHSVLQLLRYLPKESPNPEEAEEEAPERPSSPKGSGGVDIVD